MATEVNCRVEPQVKGRIHQLAVNKRVNLTVLLVTATAKRGKRRTELPAT